MALPGSAGNYRWSGPAGFRANPDSEARPGPARSRKVIGMRSSALSAEAAAADADQMAGHWPARPAAHVDIVVPVTTHQRDLELMIFRLHSFLAAEFPFAAQVTIATAGPSERTWATARRLAGVFAEVSAVRTGATG